MNKIFISKEAIRLNDTRIFDGLDSDVLELRDDYFGLKIEIDDFHDYWLSVKDDETQFYDVNNLSRYFEDIAEEEAKLKDDYENYKMYERGFFLVRALKELEKIEKILKSQANKNLDIDFKTIDILKEMIKEAKQADYHRVYND